MKDELKTQADFEKIIEDIKEKTKEMKSNSLGDTANKSSELEFAPFPYGDETPKPYGWYLNQKL